ncbi:DUF6545 domain-containing protein [Gordonia humi]|uniref:Glucan phosphoethanolaminetransferase (Alkaline phosphatase superfamily) n=1 Tax=Gordonia humi TaxID=686429 RepID=A0A840ETT1_9ACTN|nr:DUF6545 domain-containing protein [Gordonia humi]MBB4133744.1 glucan phosphoethanolaminetransferase (alkaline phosphatase superfamily) [Gordonia humi]
MTWLTWVIAVVCAAAVGSRIGRLTVRPPSLARSSVAVAAITVALAAAVRTPTVSEVLTPMGEKTPMLTFVGCWVVVFAATSLIGAASLPRMGRRGLHATTAVILLAAVADLVAMSMTGEVIVGSVFIVVTGVLSLLNGVQYVAWHPLGRAIGYYLIGIAVVIVIVATDLHRTDPGGAWWAVAIIVISFACSSVMLSSWFVARRDLRRMHTLWSALVDAHPEIATGDYQSTTTVLAATDRVSQILDGLYLHAGAGLIPAGFDDEQTHGPRPRAREVAVWLRSSEVVPIDPDKLTTPPELSDRRWVQLIALEYDRAG